MREEAGFSLIEIMATMALMGIMLAMVAPNLKVLNDPLQNATEQSIGFFKKTKARAVATTSAYLVEANGQFQIKTSYANTCNALPADFQDDPDLVLDLPTGVQLADTAWSICFSSRGLADQNLIIPMSDVDLDTRSVEVFLGGAVRET